jgi:outer membrane protein assembly factor BamE (lipoprotein component of BamABCDE complex)
VRAALNGTVFHGHERRDSMIKAQGLHAIAILLLAGLLLSMAGCSGTSTSPIPRKVSKSTFDKITNGMSEAEVKNILGEPQNSASSSLSQTDPKTGTTSESKTQMSWADGEKSITVDFVNGKVTGKKENGL